MALKITARKIKMQILTDLIVAIANGNKSRFATMTGISVHTIRTWEVKKKIPKDKVLYFEALMDNYKLRQINREYEEYFKLQNKISERVREEEK